MAAAARWRHRRARPPPPPPRRAASQAVPQLAPRVCGAEPTAAAAGGERMRVRAPQWVLLQSQQLGEAANRAPLECSTLRARSPLSPSLAPLPVACAPPVGAAAGRALTDTALVRQRCALRHARLHRRRGRVDSRRHTLGTARGLRLVRVPPAADALGVECVEARRDVRARCAAVGREELVAADGAVATAVEFREQRERRLHERVSAALAAELGRLLAHTRDERTLLLVDEAAGAGEPYSRRRLRIGCRQRQGQHRLHVALRRATARVRQQANCELDGAVGRLVHTELIIARKHGAEKLQLGGAFFLHVSSFGRCLSRHKSS
eukprot:124862-Prymnesium_polylepis.1